MLISPLNLVAFFIVVRAFMIRYEHLCVTVNARPTSGNATHLAVDYFPQNRGACSSLLCVFSSYRSRKPSLTVVVIGIFFAKRFVFFSHGFIG